MNRRLCLKGFAFLILAMGTLAGCAGGGHPQGGGGNGPGVTLSSAGNRAVVDANGTVTLTAVTQNLGASPTFSWALSDPPAGCSPLGTITPNSSSPGTAVYAPPPASSIPSSDCSVTVNVSVSGNGATVSSTFGITVTPAIAVTITNPIATIAGGSSPVSLNATVANDENSAGVSWAIGGPSCAGSGNPCGTLSNATTTSVLYTPPSTPPSPNNHVSVVASSNASQQLDNNLNPASATDTFTVTSATITLAFNPNPPFSSVVAGGSAQTITVDMTSDTTGQGVSFTLLSGTPLAACSTCGTLTGLKQGGSPSTVATITYTPPATIASTTQVTITATAVANPSLSISFTFTITVAAACGTGSESLLSGHYAIVLQGFDNGQPAAIGAVFDANGKGGVATGGTGIEDINSAGNLGRVLDLDIDPARSSYSAGSDRRGCLTLVTLAGTGNPATTAPITIKFRFALGSIASGTAGQGRIIEFDSTGSTGVNTAGVLERQDTTAFTGTAIIGTYAFGASVRQVGLGKFAIAGVFAADGMGNITSGAADYNTDNGGNLDGVNGATDFPASPLTFTGTGNGYHIGGAGRGEWTFALSDGTSVNAAVYVVNAGYLLTMRKDAQSPASPLFAGSVLRQSKSSFGPSDLNATSVGYTSGVGSAETKTQLVLVTPNGSGSFNITVSENDGGVLTGGSASGSYTVASNGRVVATGVGKHNSLLYLVTPNEAFSLGAGGSCFSGFFAAQSATTVGSATPSPLGVFDPEDSHVDLTVGVATLNNGTITGTLDDDSTGNGGTLSVGQSINETYSIDSTGTGFVPANCNFGAGTCSQLFLVISPTGIVLMDAAPTNSSASGPYPALRAAHQ